jgi:hypothetical protein
VGVNHCLGLKIDGSIVAWGWSGFNQCDVPMPNANFVTVAAGQYHSVGIKGYVLGDVDRNGAVELSDLAALLSSYGRCEGEPGYVPNADFDDSGCVDLSDLGALLYNYGAGA